MLSFANNGSLITSKICLTWKKKKQNTIVIIINFYFVKRVLEHNINLNVGGNILVGVFVIEINEQLSRCDTIKKST